MRLTYSNVMATIAVFIALGGTGVAAVTLTRNSVRSQHIAKGQVKAADLGRNAVRSSKVRNGALLAEDFAPGQLPKGDKGDTGEKGDKGDKGDTGAVGPTFGGISGDTPPALAGNSNFPVVTKEVNIPAAGDLMIFGRTGAASASCTGNPCTAHMGIYLDEQPVPGSGIHRGPGDNTSLPIPTPPLFGRMPAVSPGPHTIRIYFVSPQGLGVSQGGGGGASIGWILLGG
jgi:hypothetical protein